MDILDVLALCPPFEFGSAASGDSGLHPASHTLWSPHLVPWQPTERRSTYRYAGRIEVGFEGQALVAFHEPSGTKQSRRRAAAKARAPQPVSWRFVGEVRFTPEVFGDSTWYDHLPAVLAADEKWLAKVLGVSEEG